MRKIINTFTLLLTSIVIASFLNACSKPTNACFTISPGTITTSTDAIFNASCSENASYYKWTFGDGTPELSSTTPTVSHKYNAKGSYTVTLNADRKDGVSFKKGISTQSQAIIVQ